MDTVDIKYLFRHMGGLLLPTGDTATSGDEWFYFLHIPKTAGTSFRYALYDKFGARDIYPNSVDYYLRHRGKYLPLEQLRKRRDRLFPDSRTMLAGHYRLAPLGSRFRTPPPKTISFLRDPVERMLSSIDYNRAPGRPYHGLSREDAIARFGSVEGQLQASIFGYEQDRNNMQQALENVARIDVLGIVEQYERSIQLINAEFGWNLQGRHRRNQSGSRGDVRNIEVDRSAMATLCAPDMEVYEFGCKLFQAQCDKLNI